MTEKQEKPRRQEIIFTGFGGQGIVLAGRILGRAAALGDHKESTLVQSYGPEARGGACSAQVIISEAAIHYPHVRHPDILVCMSQGGFDKFIGQLHEKGVLLTDQDLVEPEDEFDRFFYENLIFCNDFYDIKPAGNIAQPVQKNSVIPGYDGPIFLTPYQTAGKINDLDFYFLINK